MNYTDINSRAGKGSRLEHNVSTKKYREGWDRIFGKKRVITTKPVKLDRPFKKCPECDGCGEYPVGSLCVKCPACDGEGKVVYAD